MGIAARRRSAWRAFLVGLSIGALGVYGALTVWAATAVVIPDGNGSVNNGTPQTGCVGLSNFECVDSVTSTSSSPTSEFLRQVTGDTDEFTLGTLTGVNQVTEVRLWVNHLETAANMTLSAELWNATGSVQYGGTVNFINQTVATWEKATFNTTNFPLSQNQLDGLRVRLLCTKGPGKGAECDSYAVLADVLYTQTIDVTVSAVGNQKDMFVGTTSAHVGGAFVISEDSGSRNITSITIQEQGTVDAQNDLANVGLYYELAADCSVATYDGTETPFGATTTFNGADGTATFTDIVAVTTANDLCVYPVFDVTPTASFGDTVELQITDPSTDVQGSGSPVVSPDTAIQITDTTTLYATDLTQIHYHWRDDGGDELGAASLTSGTEDSVLGNAGIGTIYRIRMEVANEGNATSSAVAYGLEYATKVTTCSAITSDTDWIAVSATGGDWDMAGTASGLADGDTQNISNAIGGVTDVGGTFVGTGGERETTGTTSAVALDPDEFYEMEFAVVAQGSASPGTTYCFRVSDDGSSIGSYTASAYPEATIAADVTVAATSTAQAQASIPATNIFGGGFAVTDATAGSHSVTSFTLTASGTVNLQEHVENITLRYESDTTAPLDCTGETYNGTETIFGTVDPDGFSAAGTSTFTETLTPPTVENGVNALCFWVEFDVTASSSDGEAIEVRVADASTDVVINSGSVSPAALVDIEGFTRMVAPNVTLEHYHWRDNTGTSTSAGSLTSGNQDTAYTEVPRESVVRLRFGVSNTGGTTTSAYQYELEWAQRVTTCTAATGWTSVDTGADEWRMVTSQLTDNADTFDISNGIGGVTNVGTFLTPNGGQQEVDATTDPISLDSGEFLELEYAIEATLSATEGSAYCFRLTNAGTALDNYSVYAEAVIKLATDFKIQRNSANILSGNSTVTITAGVDYEAPAAATTSFIRIIGTNHTARGPVAGATGNHNASDVTAYISNPNNITSSITFTRAGTANDTYIEWEIVEYIGAAGGENEIYVRDAGVVTYVAANTTVTTGAATGIVNDADVVPFITGQGNPDTGRFDYNTGLSTSAWNAGADTATFTRNEAGGDAVNVSYAIVEFTGSNWAVQRAEMNYDATYSAGTATTTPITSVGSLDKAFVHAQHRAGTDEDQHGDYGHEVWLSSIGAVSFRLNGATQNPTLHNSVAWVIENTQNVGDVMEVTPVDGSIAAGAGGLSSASYPIGKTLDDLSVSGMFFNSSNGGLGRTFPEPILSAQLLNTTQFNISVTDNADSNLYRAQIVEWPTAARKLIQSSFWIYEDDDTLDPSTAWNGGALGENAAMTENDAPMALGDNARIRVNLQVTAAALPSGVDAFNLEYAENPGSCSAVSSWSLIGDAASTTALWRGHAGAPSDGATLPTTKLSNSTIVATYEEANPSALTPNLALVGDYVEFDWNVEHNGAKDKTSYCFRMVNGDRSPFTGGVTGYDTYPILRTVGYGPVIGNWHWYDDADSLTPLTPLDGALENEAPANVANDNVIKLRVVLAEKQGADGPNTKFALQFSEYADFSQSVHNVVASSTCARTATTTAQLWCYADGAGDDNDRVTSALISDADTCTTGAEIGCGTRNEATSTPSSFTHQAFTNAEHEFTIRNNGARANAVYYFRLYDLVNDEIVVASSTYPSLQVEGAQLVFGVSGLPVGTTTEGITSDVATTPTTIPFGSVPPNTEYEAAYRLQVDTSATEGYQVLQYFTQDLLNTYGDAIPSVTGTNVAPSSWGSGCSAAATGCFGYHVGDDVLANGSTRFAADDSYAAPSTTPEEVMFSSAPTEDIVDLIYKLQISDLQPAGQYQTDIVYIVVPQF